MPYNIVMHKIIFKEGQITLVREMYEKDGLSITAIAEKFGVSYSWLNKIMVVWGIPKRRRWAKKWRRCRGCEQHFEANKDNFYHKKDYVCKKCAIKKRYVSNLQYKFGLTPGDYKDILESQDGGCAICGKPPGKRRLSVDHNHETDRVRGILCHSCNIGLGGFKDDALLLQAAIAYLDKWSE